MIYRFGPFSLNADTRQLLRDRDEVHVSPKAFDLLTMLVANRRRAMSKTDLQEQLWPSTFVDEANLAGLIAEIRRALGDSANHPAFVRTMFRFGYRFVGEVTEHTEVAAPPALIRPRPCLVFEHRTLPLLEGASVVGREADATIRCDAPGVSRYHAKLVVAGADVVVEDLGSKNGTFVNGQRVTSARLADGDELRLGTARLVFQVTLPGATTETVTNE